MQRQGGGGIVWLLLASGSVLAILSSISRAADRQPDLLRAEVRFPKFWPALALPPLMAVYFLSPAPPLLQDYAQARQNPDLADFDAWYQSSPLSASLPVPIRQALR